MFLRKQRTSSRQGLRRSPYFMPPGIQAARLGLSYLGIHFACSVRLPHCPAGTQGMINSQAWPSLCPEHFACCPSFSSGDQTLYPFLGFPLMQAFLAGRMCLSVTVLRTHEGHFGPGFWKNGNFGGRQPSHRPFLHFVSVFTSSLCSSSVLCMKRRALILTAGQCL